MMNEKKFMTSDEVYEDLCDKIEKLVYMPGDRISENNLCKLYDVSRHIVRNAITRLKDRKLITVYPQRGTFVSLIDMGFVADILYIREAVEQEALHRVIDKGNNEKLIKDLTLIVNLQQKALDNEKSMDEFYEIDNRFHDSILKAVGQGLVMNIIKEQYIHVRRWRNFEVRNAQRLKEIISDHKKIITAIDKQDIIMGREILHQHLDTVERLKDIFKRIEPEYFIFRN